MSNEILCRLVDDKIFHIEFNRPEKLNAFTMEMFREFKKCMEEGDESPAKVFLISGKGRSFSAGADLNTLANLENMDKESVYRILEEMYEAAAIVYNAEKPVITAVQGYAVGSGFGIALASDILILSKDAILRPGYMLLGLNPEFCVSLLLPHIMGFKNSFKILVMREDIHAEEAVKLGIAQYIVDKDELLDKAFEIAREISELPSYAVLNTKKLLKKTLVYDCREIIRDEARMQAENIATQEHKKYITKYLEKFLKRK
ncbi:MAG TPA: enoyl-CoA hydratase/isomerase family protein [Thermoprotei archaeon]|nr:enoyl-CoA hydratase/isomerase family protein [Thermoprotei archaeon]